jgi:fumarate reductase subunit C
MKIYFMSSAHICAAVLRHYVIFLGYKIFCITEMPMQFQKFADWRQSAAVVQREAVTVMPSCGGGDNVVVA